MRRSLHLLLIALIFGLTLTPLASSGQIIGTRTYNAANGTYSFPGTPPGGSWQGWVGLSNPAFLVNDTITDAAYPNTGYPSLPGGATDCSPALQEALDEATPGTVLIFPLNEVFIFKESINWPNTPNVAINLNGSTLLFEPTTANPTLFNMTTSAGANTYGQLVITNIPTYGSNKFMVPLGTSSTPNTFAHLVYNHSNIIPGYGTNLCMVVSDFTDFRLVGRHNWGSESLLNSGAQTNEVAQLVHVTSITTNGNAVVFTTEKPFAWNFTNHPCAYPVANPLYGAGIENGTIVDMNTNDAGQSVGMIEMGAGFNCWVKGVNFENTPSGAIWMGLCLSCQVQGCVSRYHTHVASGESYVFEFQGPCAQCIFENCAAWGGRHTMIAQGPTFMCGWAYCVAYGDNNYSESLNWGTQAGDGHAAIGVYDFFDGCLMSHLDLGSFIHDSGFMLCVAYGCVFNHDLPPDGSTPWFIGETNLPVELGQAWIGANGLQYLYNLQGVSVETSNEMNSILNSQVDIHTILSRSGATFFGLGAGPWDIGFGATAENNTPSGDLTCSNTTLIDGVYSYIRGTNTWANGSHTFSNSLYLTVAPGWWGNSRPFPFYNCNRTPMVEPAINQTLPAIQNYYTITNVLSTYTVSYSGNGNTGGAPPTDPSSPYLSSSIVTVLGNTGNLARSGYTFSDWNTAADGSGTTYNSGATFTISQNTTLFAQWASSGGGGAGTNAPGSQFLMAH